METMSVMSQEPLIIKKKKKKPPIIIIIIIFLIVGYYSYSYINEYIENNRVYSKDSSIINDTKILEIESEDQITKAIDKIYDAVLCIEVYNQSNKLVSTGTGFIYKKDSNYGYIVTNNHVVSNAKVIKGLLSNNNIVDLTLISSDAVLDIAVLRMDQKEVLKVATLGNSSSMVLGNTVIAIGSPMGSTYAGTVTRGIIAGKDRMVETASDNSNTLDYIVKVLQTDAAINPGNSGGPLVNLAGDVIGITSLKLVDTNIEGMGFAIPIEDVTKYIQRLERNEKILRPVIGVKILDITDTSNLSIYNITIDSSIENGIVIQSVDANYPASVAGLLKNDVITKLGDNVINNVAEFRYYLYKHDVGETVALTYVRGTTTKTVNILLSKSK